MQARRCASEPADVHDSREGPQMTKVHGPAL
jgi:hypothetical protein